MCGSGAKDITRQGPQQLQTSGVDISRDEDPGEAGPRPSTPTGEAAHGSSTVRVPASHRSGRRCHLPPSPNSLSPGEALEAL